ncbi:ricin-type beta-trefoil lectin domain protein [Lentzea tibetensis]|uniref:Ricin-type beta-trefoil lectin domain protein n=1 Tax=Lentzea tibetensis TaxID=2591470 RepID=A0A563F2D5_9PSEU|nr:RICIN domain-containing protein [Lentzea tibetensis]TWP53898.1 ricin-type beta-trefoil lectin domain protein [Lentzea tibetensis]
MLRRIAVFLAGIGLLAMAPATAQADGAWNQIQNIYSTRCMDTFANLTPANGVMVQQWDCNGKEQQMFTKHYLPGTDRFLLQNKRSGLCVQIRYHATWAGELLEQWRCDANVASQQWRAFDPGGNSTGAKWLVNVNSGKCVEIPGWNVDKGVWLTQSDCVFGHKQFWRGL